MRVLLKALPYALSALLIVYVGGPSLLVFVCSVLLTAAALQRWVQLRSGAGVLAALLVNLAWLSIYMGSILPRVRDWPLVRIVLTEPMVDNGFRATEFPENSVGLYWVGSLLVLATPGLISAVVLVWRRAHYAPFSTPLMHRLTWLAAMVPFAILALVKLAEPWFAVAFTMAGDGRNHYLSIEEIRATASAIPSPLTFTTPLLSNGVAALFSSGNGASGTLQQSDIFAMLSIYVLSAAALITATMTGFVSVIGARSKSFWMALPLVGVAFALATNSLVLSTSLRDGFMTLYFGAAVLGATLVLATLLPVGPIKVALIAVGVLVEVGAYTFLAPILGVILVIEIYRWLWVAAPPHRRVALLAALSLLLVVVGGIKLRSNWYLLEDVAKLDGAHAIVGTSVVWVFLAVAIALCCVGFAESRAAGITASVALIVCLALLFFIERLPANLAPGNSYYGSKTIVGTVGGVLCLAFIPLGGLFARVNPSRTQRVVATVGLTAIALVPVAVADSASSLARPWVDDRNGQLIPDSSAVEEAVERWGDEPYLFFRFADGHDVHYPDVAADRILDFWVPTMWTKEGYWSPMWNWVYSEFTSFDPAILCGPIGLGVQTIYTRDPELPAQAEDACGGSDVEFVVLPRLSSP
ncbi:MAG: hypothetical protein K8R99_12070 [Actinomycetia bacterium]|nr:hypothetical protein [Actinomycetes bacterium]